MFKTLNTRARVQNDNFSTKNVEKTVDKSKSMWYYIQAFRRDAERCWKVNQKVFLKNFQKSIDKEKRVWYTLWAVLERGSAIGPWKLNNEIRKGTRDSMIEDIIK